MQNHNPEGVGQVELLEGWATWFPRGLSTKHYGNKCQCGGTLTLRVGQLSSIQAYGNGNLQHIYLWGGGHSKRSGEGWMLRVRRMREQADNDRHWRGRKSEKTN